MPYTKTQHKDVASQMERDSEGHFIKKAEETAKGALSNIKDNVHYDKKQDDLLSVHVGNPLQRITQLLEDIKKQKAFAFTLKGTLGLAGVAVALSVFGLFGGSKILCDKGTQTEIGIVKILNAKEAENSNVPILGFVIDALKGTLGTQTLHDRVILYTGEFFAIHLPYSSKLSFAEFKDREVYATGQYDNCSQVLKVENIELTN